MAARLTDAQKKKIVADYVETGSYAAAGRMNGVSDKTVKAVVNNDPETPRISEQKRSRTHWTCSNIWMTGGRKLKM